MRAARHTTNSDKADDRELLLRTHRGDEAAARLLWEMYGPRLVRIAEGLCWGIGGAAQALDIVQGVMCAILQTSRERLRAIDDVHSYLVRSVRNAALNERRASERQARREEGRIGAAGAPVADPWAKQSLLEAVERLEPELRELIVLKHAGGLTIDEMALVLELARGTVADRYAGAMRRLRAELGADDEGASGVGTGMAGGAA